MAQLFYPAPAAEHHVFVAGAQLHLLRMDATTGNLRVGQFRSGLWTTSAEPVADVSGWCTAAPGGGALYVAVRRGEGEEDNFVQALAVDRATGALTPINRQTTVLPGSPHCGAPPRSLDTEPRCA